MRLFLRPSPEGISSRRCSGDKVQGIFHTRRSRNCETELAVVVSCRYRMRRRPKWPCSFRASLIPVLQLDSQCPRGFAVFLQIAQHGLLKLANRLRTAANKTCAAQI